MGFQNQYNKAMFGDVNLLTIFTTGLLTGGLTCVAVQGGLLTASLVQGKEYLTNEKSFKQNIRPTIVFLFSKLLAYTILGFFLGFLGSLIQVSIQTRILLQFLVVIFMLGSALNLLNVHPIFRAFLINPPQWLTKRIYKESESKNFFAPALLGFLTVFIPCGATQAMMALSVASGSPFLGAVILFTFVLGTSPIFLLLGFLTVRLKIAFKKDFIKIASFGIILLALFNLDATLALANSPYTIRSAFNKGYCIVSYCLDSTDSLMPVSEQTITFTPSGYAPNYFVVGAGSKVTLHLVNQDAQGCLQSFTISALNLQKIVLPNTKTDISFVAPDNPGKITFTCSSGLYPGTIEVI